MKELFDEIIDGIIKNNLDKEEAIKFIEEVCRKYKPSKFPKLIDILVHANNEQKKRLKKLLTKPVRTISGVAPIAIMSKPIKCKHGTCIYCPGGPSSVFGDIPQSYTGKEPATRRAIRNKFDPYLQVFNRLEHYTLLNQSPEKVELIIMGGTFPSFPKDYKEEFIKYALKALNDFSNLFYKKELDFSKFKKFFELPGNVKDVERTERIHKKLLRLKGKTSLEKEQRRNEKARIRCVAMCLETRPDYSKENEINEMLRFGTTRVEIGVQTLYNKILRLINRGHTLEDTKRAIQLSRDSFLKIGIHMMLGLPKSTEEMDINNFKQLFEDEAYRPDALKIYPCSVIPGTQLYVQYQKGQFKPLSTLQAAELLLKIKPLIPKYTRIMRILRDIPTKVTIDGVNITNFRQYLHSLMIERGIKCNCIRCREPRGRKISWEDVRMKRYDYKASNGNEIFLDYEDVRNDILLGFCRLRIPYKPFRNEITNKSAGIRELHVYGSAIPIGEKGTIQHKGIGIRLMGEAERIAREEFNMNKILVISGIGVKEYYGKKLGYKKDGVYMSKFI